VVIRGIAMKKVYRVLTPILILLIILPIGACGINNEQAIEDTVVGFFTVFQNREYSRCLEYFSTRLRDNIGDERLVNELRSSRFWSGSVRLKSMGSPTIDGKTATIWVDIEGLLGVVNTTKLTLAKESGKWKIDGY